MDLQLMAALSNADAIAANEDEVRAVLRHHLASYGLTSQTDGLGSLIFTKEAADPQFSVMIYGHMDEVGYMVRTITPEGLLRLMVVGGVNLPPVTGRTYASQPPRVTSFRAWSFAMTHCRHLIRCYAMSAQTVLMTSQPWGSQSVIW